MTRVSARAYIAAGASLIAVGAMVTNPVAPSLPDVQLPTARTVEVNLTAAEKWTVQHPVALSVTEVKKIGNAARIMVADALASTSASSVVASAEAVTKKVADIGAGSRAQPARHSADVVRAPQQAATTAVQAAAAGPNAAGILGIPLLAATVGFDALSAVAATALDLSDAAADITFGLATQDPGLFADAMNELDVIPRQFNILAVQVQLNINKAVNAFGLPDVFPGVDDAGDRPLATTTAPSGVDGVVAVKGAVGPVTAPSTVGTAKPLEAKPANGVEEQGTSDAEHKPVSSTSADGAKPSSSESTAGTTKKEPTTKTDGTTKTEDTTKQQQGETSATGITKSGDTKSGGTSKADGTSKAGVSTKSGGTSAAGGASNTGAAKAGKTSAHAAHSSGPKGDHHSAAKDRKHDK